MHNTCAGSGQTQSQHGEGRLDTKSLVKDLLAAASHWERGKVVVVFVVAALRLL